MSVFRSKIWVGFFVVLATFVPGALLAVLLWRLFLRNSEPMWPCWLP